MFSHAELGQRQRLFLVVTQGPDDTRLEEALASSRLPVTKINLAQQLASAWTVQLADGTRVAELDVGRSIRLLLASPSIVVLTNAEPVLACFREEALDLLWLRLFTESIDVRGLALLPLAEASRFLPSPAMQARHSQCIRTVESLARVR